MPFRSLGANQDKPHPVRRIVGIPTASYALLRRLADLRGVAMTTAIHDALRDATISCTGESSLTPPPFAVNAVRIEDDHCVSVAHPLFPAIVLRQREAELLASTLLAAGESAPGAHCEFRPARGSTDVRVLQSGRCVYLTVNGCPIALTRPIAVDLAQAIDVARVDAIEHSDTMPSVDLGAFSRLRTGQPARDNGLNDD